jgi:glutamine synthetase
MSKDKKEILRKAQEDFLNSSSLAIKIGIELEFFLLDSKEIKNTTSYTHLEESSILENLKKKENTTRHSYLEESSILENLKKKENATRHPWLEEPRISGDLESIISNLKSQLLKNFSLIYETQKEQGTSQVEIKSHFTSNLELLAQEIEGAKIFIKSFAKNNNLTACFKAQPFKDDCGNALQFNISMHDKNDSYSDKLIKNTIAGLLNGTNEAMLIFAPNREDYLRFSKEINSTLFKNGKYPAPSNLSYGVNNRSCAIRLLKNRLEYRVPSANADVFFCLVAILNMISEGIKNNSIPNEPIYGNAFDQQYNLENLCQSFEEAKEKFNAKKYLYLTHDKN